MLREATKIERPAAGRRSAPSLARTVQAMRAIRGRQALRPEARVALRGGRQFL
jgi:hypothetical protein